MQYFRLVRKKHVFDDLTTVVGLEHFFKADDDKLELWATPALEARRHCGNYCHDAPRDGNFATFVIMATSAEDWVAADAPSPYCPERVLLTPRDATMAIRHEKGKCGTSRSECTSLALSSAVSRWHPVGKAYVSTECDFWDQETDFLGGVICFDAWDGERAMAGCWAGAQLAPAARWIDSMAVRIWWDALQTVYWDNGEFFDMEWTLNTSGPLIKYGFPYHGQTKRWMTRRVWIRLCLVVR